VPSLLRSNGWGLSSNLATSRERIPIPLRCFSSVYTFLRITPLSHRVRRWDAGMSSCGLDLHPNIKFTLLCHCRRGDDRAELVRVTSFRRVSIQYMHIKLCKDGGFRDRRVEEPKRPAHLLRPRGSRMRPGRVHSRGNLGSLSLPRHPYIRKE
jgi:hypothetical protein